MMQHADVHQERGPRLAASILQQHAMHYRSSPKSRECLISQHAWIDFKLGASRDLANWIQLIPVDSLRVCKQELMPPKVWSSQLTCKTSAFDPRPPSLKLPDPRASERLRCSLMVIVTPLIRVCSRLRNLTYQCRQQATTQSILLIIILDDSTIAASKKNRQHRVYCSYLG